MTQNAPESHTADVPAATLETLASVLLNMAPALAGMAGQPVPPDAVDKIRGFLAIAVKPGSVVNATITLPSGESIALLLRLT